MFNILFSSDNDRGIFTLSGTIGEAEANEMKTKVSEVNASSFKEIVFDFKDVKHIGSAGLGKLLLFYKNFSIQGTKLTIQNPRQSLKELLVELKLDSLFNII